MAIGTLTPVTTGSALADPAQRRGAELLVYDGRCRFCIAQMQTLNRLDFRGQLAFLSLHDERVAHFLPGIGRQDLLKQIYVVGRDARVYGGADAIRYLSRRIPGIWWLAPLLHIPGSLWLWRWLYRQVAKRRYWFGQVDCEEGTCSV